MAARPKIPRPSKPKASNKNEWIDPDDVPELTAEWFRVADQHEGGRPVKRGLPPTGAPLFKLTKGK